MTDKKLVDTYSLPPRPEVLIRIDEEAQAKHPSPDRLASILRTDVSLLGALLQLVNSPYFGLKTQIVSAEQAIVYLSIPRTLSLVRAVALRPTVGDLSDLPRFWDTATETAQICEKLALKFTAVSREDAYTLGLFHDCGIPLMMQGYPEYKEVLREANATHQSLSWLENCRYGINHCQVGKLLAESWHLPEYISQAIGYMPVYEDVLSGAIESHAKTPSLLALLYAAKHISNQYRRMWRVEDYSSDETISALVLECLNMSDDDFFDEKDLLLSTMGEK